jgi:hypothetical protein
MIRALLASLLESNIRSPLISSQISFLNVAFIVNGFKGFISNAVKKCPKKNK